MSFMYTCRQYCRVWLFAFMAFVLIACGQPVDTQAPTVTVPLLPWGDNPDQTQSGKLGKKGKGTEAISVDNNMQVTGQTVFAACASCHMADASGRTDGQVPTLAGQRASVLRHKLEKLRLGQVDLPVMTPFARALSTQEMNAVTLYLADLGLDDSEHQEHKLAASLTASASAYDSTEKSTNPNQPSILSQSGASAYAQFCASCHGEYGEGNDDLLAPKLCGQYAPYLNRRIDEIIHNTREDADPAMRALVRDLPAHRLDSITQWLATQSVAGCLDSNHRGRYEP